MANTAGGAIVLGVADRDGYAIDAPGVDVTDDETTRMYRIVASNTAPVPDFEILQIRNNSASDSKSFYVILVPQSPAAPHAVIINQALRYSKRNGTETRHLAEAEVATAYLERARGTARQRERMANIVRDSRIRLNPEVPWLLVNLVPDVPGNAVVDSPSFAQFRNAMLQSSPMIFGGGLSFHGAHVGQGCLIADDSLPAHRLARHVSLQVHKDGSGAFGIQLYTITAFLPVADDQPNPIIINDEAVARYGSSERAGMARDACPRYRSHKWQRARAGKPLAAKQ